MDMLFESCLHFLVNKKEHLQINSHLTQFLHARLIGIVKCVHTL